MTSALVAALTRQIGRRLQARIPSRAGATDLDRCAGTLGSRRRQSRGSSRDCWGVSEPLFIVVSGPPASGKSTLAPTLAAEFSLPLIAKDTIKDALMSVLPVPDVAASRELGRAAVLAMLAVAAASPVGAVVESNFYRSLAVAHLQALPGRVVEIFCRCDAVVAAERYQRRAGSRQAGHFDAIREPHELWNDEVTSPVAGGWPLLEVETNEPVEVAQVVAFVRSCD